MACNPKAGWGGGNRQRQADPVACWTVSQPNLLGSIQASERPLLKEGRWHPKEGQLRLSASLYMPIFMYAHLKSYFSCSFIFGKKRRKEKESHC